MSELNFVIPLTRDELCDGRYEGERYVVTEVCDVSTLSRKLRECKSPFVHDGPSFILKHFDTFFSVLVHFQSTDDTFFQLSWGTLLKASNKMKEDLSELLSVTGADIDTRTKKVKSNTLKMIMYLLMQHVVAYETLLDKKNKKVMEKINNPKGKRSGKTSSSKNSLLHDWNWDQEVVNVVVLTYNLFDLPLCRLFSSPVPDEQFINMIGNACFKLLQDPDISVVRFKTLRECVFDMLGLLVRNYGYSAEFVTRILKLISGSSEAAVSAFARGLAATARKHSLETLVRAVTVQMVNEMAAGGEGAVKDFQLLVDIAEADPGVILSCADLLTDLLDKEPYTIRTATLSIFGEVVQHTLSTNSLDKNEKEVRDEMLENIIAHLYDGHAFVRSKVLQILLRLYKSGAIPLHQSVPLLENVIVRLKDRVANVKKFALQLVTCYVQNNSFATKYREEELLARLEAEEGLEAELKAKCSHIPSHIITAYETWLGMEELVANCVREVLGSDKIIAEELAMGTLKKTLTQEEIAEYLVTCQRCLDQNQIRTAFLTLLRCEAQTNMDTSSWEMANRVRFYVTVLSKVAMERSPEGLYSKEEMIVAVPDIWTNDPVALLSSDREMIEELTKRKRMLLFYNVSYNTTKELNQASGIIYSALNSSLVSDVVEAINFFTMAHSTKLEGVDKGIRKILSLTCSSDDGIKKAVSHLYWEVYMAPQIQAPKARADIACTNLTTLLSTVTLREKAALDKIMGIWATNGIIDTHLCRTLWDRFTMVAPNTTPYESVAAIMLLEMVWRSGYQLELLKNSMIPLAKFGFGQRGVDDNRLVMYVCRALRHLNPNKLDKDSEPIKLSSDHTVITSLANLLVTEVRRSTDTNYLAMCCDAIDLIYSLSLDPDIACEFILKNMFAQCKSEVKAVRSFLPVEECSPSDSFHKRCSLLCMMVCRLIHCVGHVAVMHVVYMEHDVLREWKRKAEKVEAETKKKKEEERQARKELGEDEMDLDDELVGAIADDQDAETVRDLCENELLNKTNLLGLLANFIVKLMSISEISQCEPLYSTAFLTLGKLMAVSPAFLNSNMKVLATFAMQCGSLAVRSNFAIILRDLSFRFPTAMEPHLPHLFMRLRDECDEVRENALLCSATLILSQMVKVKSCVTDLALCILDANSYIATGAKQLFRQMSVRGNDLYNAMPDIISRLTNEKLEEQHFDEIMTFIMGLIQKDRHYESLVEKLCTRLRFAENERQWRDLAYCLLLITYNEKSLRKLVDNFHCYSDKFEHEPVLQYFEVIRDKAAKQATPELKKIIDELDLKMNKRSANNENEGDGVVDRGETEAPPPMQKKNKRGRRELVAKTPRRLTRRNKVIRRPSSSSSE